MQVLRGLANHSFKATTLPTSFRETFLNNLLLSKLVTDILLCSATNVQATSKTSGVEVLQNTTDHVVSSAIVHCVNGLNVQNGKKPER